MGNHARSWRRDGRTPSTRCRVRPFSDPHRIRYAFRPPPDRGDALETFLTVAAVVLAANLLVGVLRVSRGPDVRDRIAGLILLSTTGTAVLLVLAHTVDEPALRVVAAVVVALAAVIVVSLVVHERGRP